MFPSFLPLAAVGIQGPQASTGDEGAARAGCEKPGATYAKGTEDVDSPHGLSRTAKNLTSPLRKDSVVSCDTQSRKMEEEGSGRHPGMADTDRRKQYSLEVFKTRLDGALRNLV